MREIKFREWETERKTMVIGEREDYDDSVGFRFAHEEGGERILMQSTGMKDKNGVEIYEGDIVHWITEFISPMDMRTKYKIDSNEEVHQKESGEWVMGEVGNTLSEELLNVEAIGNICENQELLEREAE